ncbi:MAG: hypothetical protein WDN25_01225 [Acetobacteraceae bacterium]
MTTAAELRAEAARLRETTSNMTDPEVLAQVSAMIAELEHRARQLGDGNGADAGNGVGEGA